MELCSSCATHTDEAIHNPSNGVKLFRLQYCSEICGRMPTVPGRKQQGGKHGRKRCTVSNFQEKSALQVYNVDGLELEDTHPFSINMNQASLRFGDLILNRSLHFHQKHVFSDP